MAVLYFILSIVLSVTGIIALFVGDFSESTSLLILGLNAHIIAILEDRL